MSVYGPRRWKRYLGDPGGDAAGSVAHDFRTLHKMIKLLRRAVTKIRRESVGLVPLRALREHRKLLFSLPTPVTVAIVSPERNLTNRKIPRGARQNLIPAAQKSFPDFASAVGNSQ